MKPSKILIILGACAMTALPLTGCEPKKEVVIDVPAEPQIDLAELARLEREAKVEAARKAIAAQQSAQSPEVATSTIAVETQHPQQPKLTQTLTANSQTVTPDTHPEKYKRPEDKNLLRRSDGPPKQQKQQ